MWAHRLQDWHNPAAGCKRGNAGSASTLPATGLSLGQMSAMRLNDQFQAAHSSDCRPRRTLRGQRRRGQLQRRSALVQPRQPPCRCVRLHSFAVCITSALDHGRSSFSMQTSPHCCPVAGRALLSLAICVSRSNSVVHFWAADLPGQYRTTVKRCGKSHCLHSLLHH